MSERPLENKRKSAWPEHPDYKIMIEDCERRIRVVYNDEIIADSGSALLLQEQDHPPIYYFPPQDVRLERLLPNATLTFCPYKGDANHWSLFVKEKRIELAAWSYLDPFDEVERIKDYIAFYPQLSFISS